MRIWVKLLIGTALGFTIGYLLPAESQRAFAVLQWLERAVLNIGRYAVVPVLVFSMTIAVYKLRQEDQFWPLIFRNILFIVVASLLVIGLGILTVLFFSPGRIPIERTEQVEVLSLDTLENIMAIFPPNMLSVLGGDGNYLFPLCVFAFFMGVGLNYDRNFTKPVISLIDSLSRVFYHIASFFSEILGFIMIVLAAYWAVRFHEVIKIGVFRNLMLMLGGFSLVFGFGILPLILYFLKPRVNPWRVLYGYLGPAITAFFSGDINFTLPVLLRHSKENFGIRRRSNTISLCLFNVFCRGGSAMVAAAALIVIIRSYSYLSIPPLSIAFIGLQAFFISFVLARHPGDGAYIALAVLCLGYGGGEYSAGYLLLKPIAFFLVAIGVFLDIMLCAFGTYIVARTSGNVEEKGIVHFI